jgi:hypothetical protein
MNIVTSTGITDPEIYNQRSGWKSEIFGERLVQIMADAEHLVKS